MRRSVATFALISCAAAIPAQELPVAEVEVAPAEVSVGETIRLRVTVLSPTWFPTPPEFPSFELANVVVRLPPNSSRPTSRRIGRDTWSGIVRNYEIHPLLGARYRLDDLTIQVTYADPNDRSPLTVAVDLPPVEFRAVVPAGAETLDPYLAGRQLTLTRDIEGETDTLEAGDALVVRYTAELDGLPAMFLPTLVAIEDIAGVSVYADQPLVEDAERSRRSETLTYVFEAGGQFEIPAVELSWWNTETSAIEIASVRSLTVSVAGPPIPADADLAADRPTAWRSVAAWLAILVLAAFAGWRGLRLSRRHLRAATTVHRRSEAYAFGQLRKTLRSKDTRQVHHALLRWLERLKPGLDTRSLTRICGDDELTVMLDRLSAAAYADDQSLPLPREFESRLRHARRRFLRRRLHAARPALPPLNP